VPEKRYRLVKLRPGDTVTVAGDARAVSGKLVRFETDGLWIETGDGMAYRYALGTADRGGRSPDAQA